MSVPPLPPSRGSRAVLSRRPSHGSGSTSRWRSRSRAGSSEHDLQPGDKLPAERELAARLGVSRATLSQALVALEVIGAVAVRHGDGTVVAKSPGASRIVEAVRAHADRMPEIIETRDALETKIASLAASRRTEADLQRIEDALILMEEDVAAGGRGVEGDEHFHASVTAAAHSQLLSRLMGEIAHLIRETRIESLSQPGRPTRVAGRSPSHRRRDPGGRPGRRCSRHARARRDGQRRRRPPHHVTSLEQVAVLLAGLGAGILTSTVGVASLLSFPVLVAVGLPPVVANASNTVGMTPGALSGSWGYRTELREHPRVTAIVLATCAVGSVVGAVLLLALPAAVFESVVPWLILGTCLLVGIQPRLSARLRARRGIEADDRLHVSPVTAGFATLTGVYGGYFGAGSGVMMLAVLGLGTDLPFRIANALKTLAVLAANLIASVIFVFAADIDWRAVVLLASGSVVGGYVGARIGRRLPPPLLRAGIVIAGLVGAFLLWR